MQVLLFGNTHVASLHKGLGAVCIVHTLVPESILPECTVDFSDGSAESTGQLEHILWVLPEPTWQQTNNKDVGGWVLLMDVLQVLHDSAQAQTVASEWVRRCASKRMGRSICKGLSIGFRDGKRAS